MPGAVAANNLELAPQNALEFMQMAERWTETFRMEVERGNRTREELEQWAATYKQWERELKTFLAHTM